MKKIICLIIFLFMGSVTVYAQLSKDDAWLKFSSANDAYKQNHFKEAAAFYEEVAAGGWESGAVYYNLAGSYLRQGQLGKAVVNYERARRLMPRDRDLHFNYQYVLSLVKNHASSQNDGFLEKIIHKFAGEWSKDEMILFIFILFFILGAFHLIGLYGKLFRSLRIFGLLIIFVGIIVFAAGIVYKSTLENNSAVVLVNTEAQFEPKEGSTVYFQLFEGNKIKVIEENDGWVKIKRNDEKLGWIPAKALEKI